MDYEKFIDEVQRRAGLITRGQTKLFAGSYLEILRERLSGEKSDRLAAHLPEELAGHLEGGGGGGKFSVCEFYERFAQRAGIAPEEATRYARHIELLPAADYTLVLEAFSSHPKERVQDQAWVVLTPDHT